MSMTAALGNFLNWQERSSARRDHHPLQAVEDDTDEVEIVPDTTTRAGTTPLTAATATTADPVLSSDRPDASERASTVQAETVPVVDETPASQITTSPPGTPGQTVRQAMRDGDGLVRTTTESRISLQELEGERELARRKTNACVLLAVFVLFRLWIEAIAHADFGLLMLCLVGTSWTARWIRYNRDREEELDRRVQALVENAEDGTTDVNRTDLRMLSFQAQLALAIMESQRNMMEGGYGHPDGHGGHGGVSEEARAQWEDFQFQVKKSGNAKYGSVTQNNDVEKGGENEDVCTICLGDYEDGDQLSMLPCNHIYHADCISSWTSNHSRCPLCNYDLSRIHESSSTLSSEAGSPSSSASSSQSSVTDDDMV